MANPPPTIDNSYEQFYAKRAGLKVYPTEFVVRTFLASYPGLSFRKPQPGDRVLDIAFGDGRNTVFLCDQGYAVSGIEITEGIVRQTGERLSKLGHQAELRVGRNSHIPFEDDHFDHVLACHCCYYCDDGETFADNMKEYARVMKPGAWLVASVAMVLASVLVFDWIFVQPRWSLKPTDPEYFFTFAIMLSLLVFIFEGVRDAFDPRKTFR